MAKEKCPEVVQAVVVFRLPNGKETKIYLSPSRQTLMEQISQLERRLEEAVHALTKTQEWLRRGAPSVGGGSDG